jgi:hypothetical protein
MENLLGYYVHKDDKELTGVSVMVVLEDEDGLYCYSPIGQHHTMSREYFEECVEITKEEYIEASSCYTPSEYLQ